MSTSRLALRAAALVALALTVVGCDAGTSPGQPGTSAPSVAPTSTTGSTPATPTAPPSGGAATGGAATGEPARCTASVLSASRGGGDGGAAGSVELDLVLTNTGDVRCTLQGWPGVSLVGDGNGTQLGAAGELDRSSPHQTVTLDPGQAAHAPLRIAQAENYPQDTCQPVTADGLRVYPPGETNALFVPTDAFTACRNPDVSLITVQAVLPGT